MDLANQFIFEHNGQRGELPVGGLSGSMPQNDSPLHDLISATGRNPHRTCRSMVEKLTSFFATGQSKRESGMVVSDKVADGAGAAPQGRWNAGQARECAATTTSA
jgi:hypothetical protein